MNNLKKSDEQSKKKYFFTWILAISGGAMFAVSYIWIESGYGNLFIGASLCMLGVGMMVSAVNLFDKILVIQRDKDSDTNISNN